MDEVAQDVRDRPPVTAEDIEKMGKFSQCVREHGIPEWPDPKADGNFPIDGTPIDPKSDRFQDAQKACRKYYDGPLDDSGRGGRVRAASRVRTAVGGALAVVLLGGAVSAVWFAVAARPKAAATPRPR